MVRNKGIESIREALKRVEEELSEDIEPVWNKAEKWVLETQKSSSGHGAGLNHCKCVEENLSKLIPDKWKGTKVNATELFILSASACLHDNGKIDPSTHAHDHGITGAEEIRRIWSVYKLDEMQASIVADIIEVHTDSQNRLYKVEDLRQLGSDEIHLRDLSALFCLADALDTDYRRILKGSKDDPVTQFRRQISGWYFDPDDEDCIRIESLPKNFADEEAFWRGLEYLRSEIEPIALQLKQAGYPSKILGKVIDTHLIEETTPFQDHGLPGLDFFTERDKSIFQGRKEETERLRGTVLSEVPICLLFGMSGVGKTSLILAGLFPKLKRTDWRVVHCRLGFKDPVSQIIKDVHRELLEGEPIPGSIIEAFEQVDKRHEGEKKLIVLDQFEDALRASPKTLHGLKQAIQQVMTRRFPTLHLLISYQVEAHAGLVDFLSTISIYPRQLPSRPLLPLTREGAKQAVETSFEIMQIGLDPTPKSESGTVIDLILDDIKAQGHGFYPPYIQIVALTLVNAAQTSEKIVTLELYNEQGGVSSIIGRFLLNQLKEFGNQRELTEKILKALVGEGGFIKQISFEELQREVIVDTLLLREILISMETKRLVRPVEGGKYEIIHPYLARLVDQELGEEERELKRLLERLFFKSREYASTRDFLSMTDLARLYLVRDQISLDNTKAKLLMHCCLAGVGPGWYWFRNWTAEECLPFINEALSHPHEALRKNATELIAILKGKAALPELIQKLKDGRSSVKEAAVWAIANVKAYQALPELRDSLYDDSWAVREATVRALGILQEQEASSEIKDLFQDKYWQVKTAAVETFGKLEGANALKELLQHKDWALKATAVKCVAEAEGQQSLSWLRPMLHDPDWAVKEAAIKALLKLGDMESLKEIRQMMMSTDWAVKEAAVEAVVITEGDNALPTLQLLLTSPDPYMKRAAIRLIAQLAGKKAPPRIAKFLYDRNDNVRIATIEALIKTNGEESLKKFLQKLPTENEKVRRALAKGIAEIGSDEEAMKLAQMIDTLKFGELCNTVNEALVRLDRNLYFPFKLAALEFFSKA